MADNTISCDNSSRLLVNSAIFRDCNLVRNKCCCGYTCGNEYCAGSKDVISDGDCRGRDPQSPGAPIGTCIDIADRTCSIAINSNRYTPGHEYCSATA
jgi:hypothetical protein